MLGKSFFMILITVFISGAIYSQSDSALVHFVVKVKNFSDTNAVFIAGNNGKLGDWNPDEVRLRKVSDTLWSAAFYFNTGSNLEFKFTKGSWDEEAVNDDGSVPQNYTLRVNSDTTFSIAINKWRDEFKYELHGQITGFVEYHRDFTYEKLLPRDIIVWLPPDYYENESRNYPVLYMHDGQNVFDPATSSFGVDWQADETADSLIRNSVINPMIIVGINNTSHRLPEYTYGDTGHAYMEFVVKKLKPFVDETYRTISDKENTFTAGSSLGGLISFMLAWEYPDVFNGAACFSPAFKIAQLDYVKFVKEYKGPQKQVKLYIDNGGVGLEADLQQGVDDMLAELKNKGYIEGKDFIWVKDSTALHNEAAWAKRFGNPLKLFFGKNSSEGNTDKLGLWRTRTMAGVTKYFNAKRGSNHGNESITHISINSRYKSADSDSTVFNLNMTLEHGLNVGLFEDNSPTILYYAKAGPELRILNNYYVDLHFGVCGGLYYSFGGIFFLGGETGFVFPISNDLSLEIELGVNGLDGKSFFPYLIAGISF